MASVFIFHQWWNSTPITGASALLRHQILGR